MSVPVVLGAGMGFAALLGLVGGVVLFAGGRQWRWSAVWTVVLAVGWGLFALATAQDFQPRVLAVMALAITTVGVVGGVVESVKRPTEVARAGPAKHRSHGQFRKSSNDSDSASGAGT